MDFGEILFLIMIGIGGLSSLFGKKTSPQKRPPNQAGEPPRPTPSSRQHLSKARGDVKSAMEEILRELQIGPAEPEAGAASAEAEGPGPVREPAPPVAQPSSPPPRPRRAAPPPARARPARSGVPASRARDLPPRPVPARPSPMTDLERYASDTWSEAATKSEAAPLNEASHEDFHSRYVKPVRKTRATRSGAARVRRFMNREGLRDAILAHEIFGPPKGLQ